MAIRPIHIYGDPVLRKTAEPIEDITPEIRELAQDMGETMFEAPGVGLAAPQVGVSLRLFVIDPTFGDEPGEFFPFINPVLSNPGKTTVPMEEGCLSVPDIRAEVSRPESISIDFTTIDGEQMHIDADEMLARVIQHEFDHLDGKLFIDRINPLRRKMLNGRLKAIAKQAKNPSAVAK